MEKVISKRLFVIALFWIFALAILAQGNFPSVIYTADGKVLGIYGDYTYDYTYDFIFREHVNQSHTEGLAPYFRKELWRMLMAKKPVRSNYLFSKQKFIDDSISWAHNPLYGWVEKNPKPDGSKWNIYRDGLKIYTTIDSRMQQHAEDAVVAHLSQALQPTFNKEKYGKIGAPYTSNRNELSEEKLQRIIRQAIKQSERYLGMIRSGKPESVIMASFDKPTKMRVFKYNGMCDTIMTPRDSILYYKHFLRAGLMAMNPHNGHVKAYVGGPNFRAFPYDMVSIGRRQIGSLIQPFLYAYAMEEGFTPCDEILNTQPILYDEAGRAWTPRNNSSERVGEMVDLRWSLTNSNNWISARLMCQLSPNMFVRNLHNLGITNQIVSSMLLCLGPCDVSLKEMVTAYSVFANEGKRVNPLFVTSIEDSKGRVLSNFATPKIEVISCDANNKMLTMLLNVTNSDIGNRLRRDPFGITAQIGGKIGSTGYNNDGWFVGFTPEIVVGTWVGGEDRYIHFDNKASDVGAMMALPIFGYFMKQVYADPILSFPQHLRFDFPAGFNPCGEYIDEPNEDSIMILNK